jgi:hypothetical protein
MRDRETIEERESRWLDENRDDIAAYNRGVANDGLLSDELGASVDPAHPPSIDQK